MQHLVGDDEGEADDEPCDTAQQEHRHACEVGGFLDGEGDHEPSLLRDDIRRHRALQLRLEVASRVRLALERHPADVVARLLPLVGPRLLKEAAEERRRRKRVVVVLKAHCARRRLLVAALIVVVAQIAVERSSVTRLYRRPGIEMPDRERGKRSGALAHVGHVLEIAVGANAQLHAIHERRLVIRAQPLLKVVEPVLRG
mmetsp:Transcript_52123/g.122289  ORF Transcript_52123/g.122289 Transcript_52123/m.122289 type:complete len:200 (-) Transcript_52123:1366-1965(-)